MGDKRFKTGRRTSGGFSMWPHACATHANFYALTINARALLFGILGQYRGNNNGDLDVSYHRMKREGWRSRNTVEKARIELEERGWIVRTRQGWRHQCSLYGVTFQPIDECNGKLDEPSSMIPLGFWKEGKNPWLERQKPNRPPPPQNKTVVLLVRKLAQHKGKEAGEVTRHVGKVTHHVG